MNGKGSYNTSFGGCLTVLCFIAMVIYFGFLMMQQYNEIQ